MSGETTEPTTEPSYGAPVNQLLSIGQPQLTEKRDYTTLGFSREHIPELIRMATDPQLNDGPGDGPLVWGPVHAWRALGQLKAAEAVEPLLSLFRLIDEGGDDWATSDLPRILGQIGAPALEPSANYLADPAKGEWARISAADTLGKIGEAHPDLRAACVAKLIAQLEKFSEQSEILNAFVVLPLLGLKAVEAMPVIERAFAADGVDETVVGDLEDAQIELGLKAKREQEPTHHLFPEFFTESSEGGILDEPAAPLPEPYTDEPYIAPVPYIAPPKIGRNEPCPCGSGKKYKKCCGG